MSISRSNCVAAFSLLFLSVAALLAVFSGYTQPPQTDEGSAAHIFQLSIVLMFPTLCVFLATADWTQPKRMSRRLALPGGAVALAFAALYYLEHFR
jgi:hypothetical protein